MKKIVVLDAATLGSDVDKSIISELGNVTWYETTTKQQTKERISNAEIIITNKAIIDKEEMEAAPNLKLICVAATGYNIVNVNEATKKGITVCNVKSYSTESVAQLVFTFMLASYNSILNFDSDIRKGKWHESPIFTLLTYPVIELKGKTLGIIGYGTIGKRVAEIARVFGMNVLIGKREGIDYKDNNRTDLIELYKKSDILTIHTPLSEQTKNLITLKEIELMKHDAVLINTARGGIINQDDLYIALKNKRLKCACLDVLTEEPPVSGHKLFELENIIIMPHIGWTSQEARRTLVQGVASNIKKYYEGKTDEIKVN